MCLLVRDNSQLQRSVFSRILTRLTVIHVCEIGTLCPTVKLFTTALLCCVIVLYLESLFTVPTLFSGKDTVLIILESAQNLSVVLVLSAGY